MPKDISRPMLTTSTTDFALPSYSVASSSSYTLEDCPSPYQRIRRPSVLAPKAYLTETRLASPLQTSFTLQPSPKLVASQSDVRPASSASSSTEPNPSSGSDSSTSAMSAEEEPTDDSKLARAYRSSPRRYASTTSDCQDSRPYPKRKISFPPKQARIMNLLAEESSPADNEVKSEATFQRLLAAENNLPHQPRTPRSVSDRGRFPEEAVTDDYFSRDDTPSDDECEPPFQSLGGTLPINIARRSNNSEDMAPSLTGSPCQMDVDAPSCSPRSVASSLSQWRATPPPTSAVRSTKRKLDDRFDPYPTKRRAVSPSISQLRDTHSGMGSPRGIRPIAIPITIPSSVINSAASSPTMAGGFSRPMNFNSSPTLRASMGLASPILRPLMRARRDERDEREIEGAGDAVGGLRLA